MSVITESIVIKKPAEEIFEVLANPFLVLPLLPGLRSVTDVKLPLKPGSVYSWQYQLLGLNFKGKWIVDELKAPHYYAARSQGGIDSKWSYTLIPKGEGTYVTLEIDYGAPTSLVQRYALSFIEPHTQKLAETYLHGLKAYIETQPAKKEDGM